MTDDVIDYRVGIYEVWFPEATGKERMETRDRVVQYASGEANCVLWEDIADAKATLEEMGARVIRVGKLYRKKGAKHGQDD